MASVRGPGTATRKGIPWDVEWIDADGRKLSKRFYDETQARKWAGKVEYQVQRGENTDPRAGRKTFRQVAEDWEATKLAARADTLAKYKRQLELYAFPEFGSRRIASITAAQVGKFVQSLRTTESGKPRRAGGIERIMYPTRAVFGYALDEGLIPRDPTRKVPNPGTEALGQDDFEGTALTPAKVAALATECQSHDLGNLIVWFVALTGVRAGELDRLNIGHVNALHRYVMVPGTKSKRSKSRRVDYAADLSPRLHAYLKTHPRKGDATAPLFYGRKATSGEPDPFSRLGAGTFYKRVFKPAAVRLGIGHIRFHDLRHTAGSWWIESGYSLEEVADRLGHADINFTRRTYIHQLHTRASASADQHAVWLAAQLKAPSNVVPLRKAAG
jgi:integrase